MMPKPAICTALAAAGLLAVTLFPQPSNGQAAGDEEAMVGQLLIEVAAQHKVVADNQTKIEEKIALIAEEIRISRIYAGRAGGKGAGK
jgi:hypothetical protein